MKTTNTPIIDRDLTKEAPHSPRNRIAGLHPELVKELQA